MLKYLLFALLIILAACSAPKLTHHAFPKPIDTQDQVITPQLKKEYNINGLKASNKFDGARMNGFEQINDSTYRVTILPENEPINASPHYAFWLKAEQAQNIDLEIFYGNYKHRYYPKLSKDKTHWQPIDSIAFDTLKAGNLATLRLELDTQPLYIAAEEIRDSRHTKNWLESLATQHSQLHIHTIGQSKLKRDIWFTDLGDRPYTDKPTIIIMSRAHPPEISGHMAMEAFVEEILEGSPLGKAFRERYRVLLYPLLNPDGVDLGHWRHNAGGIDLNRDWAEFRQEETGVVASHVIETTHTHGNKVLAGLDFHSTQEDVIYTHTDNRRSGIFPFKDLWVEALGDITKSDPNEEAYDLSSPMTKGWFFLEFGAEAIIYEVGDETDRAFLKYKAQVAAREMMKLLVLKDY